MRTWGLLSFAAVIFSAAPLAALDVPPRTDRYVNDYADVLPPAQEQELEGFLSALDRQTSNQIVVVTLGSLEGLPPEEVTLRFAEAWKPGQADRDNGVVVGVFPNDRKARIEVGYGLEGAIPDAVAATIMRNEMLPAFREGNWYAGINAGVHALAQAAAGEYNAPVRRSREVKLSPLGIFLLLFFGIAFWIFFAIVGRRGYTAYGPGRYTRRGGYWGGPWGGGGFGGGRGGFGGGGGGFGGGGASGNW